MILQKIVTRQASWTQSDLYDAVFALRMILAVCLGVLFGLGSMEGLYAFLTCVFFERVCLGETHRLGSRFSTPV